jgi:hypothetical protein
MLDPPPSIWCDWKRTTSAKHNVYNCNSYSSWIWFYDQWSQHSVLKSYQSLCVHSVRDRCLPVQSLLRQRCKTTARGSNWTNSPGGSLGNVINAHNTACKAINEPIQVYLPSPIWGWESDHTSKKNAEDCNKKKAKRNPLVTKETDMTTVYFTTTTP